MEGLSLIHISDLLDGGDDEYDGDGLIDSTDGTDEPDPPYTYGDGNTYADLGNTNWYGWFRMENYKNCLLYTSRAAPCGGSFWTRNTL